MPGAGSASGSSRARRHSSRYPNPYPEPLHLNPHACFMVGAREPDGTLRGINLNPYRGMSLIRKRTDHSPVQAFLSPQGSSRIQHTHPLGACRGTWLIRKRTPLGPYRSPMTRVLGGSQGGGRFLMGEVPLYACSMVGTIDAESQTLDPPSPMR